MRPGSLLLVAVLSVGCDLTKTTDPGLVCTAIAVSALNVTVRDAASGAPVCDATVTAVERGGTRYTLRQTGSCTYAGAEEHAGEFAVAAEKAGYQAGRVTGVRVGRDECHVIPVQLVVDVRPN